MTFTAADLERVISDLDYFEWGYERSLTVDGVEHDLKWVQETGGMDEGSNATWTFKIGEQYFKKEGYYASHYGYDYDGEFYEVRPVIRQVEDFDRL